MATPSPSPAPATMKLCIWVAILNSGTPLRAVRTKAMGRSATTLPPPMLMVQLIRSFSHARALRIPSLRMTLQLVLARVARSVAALVLIVPPTQTNSIRDLVNMAGRNTAYENERRACLALLESNSSLGSRTLVRRPPETELARSTIGVRHLGKIAKAPHNGRFDCRVSHPAQIFITNASANPPDLYLGYEIGSQQHTAVTNVQRRSSRTRCNIKSLIVFARFCIREIIRPLRHIFRPLQKISRYQWRKQRQYQSLWKQRQQPTRQAPNPRLIQQLIPDLLPTPYQNNLREGLPNKTHQSQ